MANWRLRPVFVALIATSSGNNEYLGQGIQDFVSLTVDPPHVELCVP